MTRSTAETAEVRGRCGAPFCLCGQCVLAIGDEHRAADKRCGREWVCQCGSCRRARVLELKDIERMFRRIKSLEKLAAGISSADDVEGGE